MFSGFLKNIFNCEKHEEKDMIQFSNKVCIEIKFFKIEDIHANKCLALEKFSCYNLKFNKHD